MSKSAPSNKNYYDNFKLQSGFGLAIRSSVESESDLERVLRYIPNIENFKCVIVA